MTPQLSTALSLLDPNNGDHWTSDGLPRIEALRLLSGDPTLTRETVTAEAPGFTKAKAPWKPVASTPWTAAQGGDPAASRAGTEPVPISAPAAPQPPATPEDGNGTETEIGDGRSDDADHEPESGDTPAAPPAPPASDRLEEARQAKAAADKNYQEALAEHDASIVAADRAGAQETLVQQVRAYHQRQLETLQKRGELRQRLHTAGVDLKELARLTNKSPLDQAFARKTGRGGQRPNIPLKR